jgi:MFS transporter, FSR family, fosmidomycin resistance protein
MTQAIERSTGTAHGSDARVIGLISAAHFVSHYYILLLPPLFAFVRADYGVSYTELGLALTAFNIVSAALQTPAGFLVDRVGPHRVLIAGMVLGAAAIAVAGMVPSFWLLVAMWAVAGLGNTVYHPADYAILSRVVSAERIGRAFSVHTFSGMLGSAVAPASLLYLHSLFGWRGAFIVAAALGFAVAAVLAWQGGANDRTRLPAQPADTPGSAPAGWPLLTSAPILRNLLFFVMLAVSGAGISNYSVVALGAQFGTPPATANLALTVYLLLGALGVLLGGGIATRTPRHGLVAALGLAACGVAALVVGLGDLTPLLLVFTMAVGGLCNGMVMPSRDMIVRAVTPRGSFGKVFGFVTTGFNIGGIVSPLIFGALMDHGRPQLVFLVVAGCCLVAVLTVATRTRSSGLV